MVNYTTIIKKLNDQGEKTGWTYIEVNEQIATQLMPGNKKGFRVKGKLDNYVFEGVSLLPMGGGSFIMPLNATVRRGLGKTKGAVVNVKMAVDEKPFVMCKELMDCLADEPAALAFFNSLPGSHQRYFSKWVESAKTDATKAKRIAQAVNGCARGMGYGEMIRALKNDVRDLG